MKKILITVEFCFPYKVPEEKYVTFDGKEVGITEERSEATDFKEWEQIEHFFTYLLENKQSVRIKDSMYMNYTTKIIKGKAEEFGDKLELVYHYYL